MLQLKEYFAAPAATHFANSGKVGKAPFKGEMFRLISPLKIPLFSDQERGLAPLLGSSLRGGWRLVRYFFLAGMVRYRLSTVEVCSSLDAPPVTLYRLRGPPIPTGASNQD